ncbi:MAG: metallophosphoesterase [Candidatus Omnitrophica bacterium]|nr:metallophosphoesterase [Candidatus Omnitrophota bacterium]
MNRTFNSRVYLVLTFLWAALFCRAAFAADIVIYGDSQSDAAAQRKVVRAIMQVKPAIVFRVGDIVNDGDDPGQWELFRKIAAPLLKSAEYFPALGNHDGDSRLYFENFPYIRNRRWYSLDRMGVHFIILDSNSDLSPESIQYRWLESDLQKAGRDSFKIVLLHHPLYSVGSHREDEKGLRPGLVPLFAKYGVCAVFSGHDHNYQRFLRGNVYYIVTGGGGSPLYERTRDSPHLNKFVKAYHFCLLSPQGNVLKVSVFDDILNEIDSFNIPANPALRLEDAQALSPGK